MGKRLSDFKPFMKSFAVQPRFKVGDWVVWTMMGFGWNNGIRCYGQIVLVMASQTRSRPLYDILPVEYMNVLEHKRLVCREEDALTPTTETEALLSVLERAANA